MKRYIKKNAGTLLLGLMVFVLSSFTLIKPQDKPVVYLIGDSTVKNGRDDGQHKGAQGLWGWGHYLAEFVDTNRISVANHALGGTSSRSYINMGLWDKVVAKLKPGDYVMMQFGHNDSGPLDDTARARGTIKGIGEEFKEVYNPMKYMQKQEVVHSYGWYLRKYVADAKAKGAVAIICSPVPRNRWKEGKPDRNNVNSYGQWAAEVAKQTGAYFIDLNKIICDAYEAQGEEKVKTVYFGTDPVHTIEAGARFNTQCVVDGLKQQPEIALNKYLIK